MSLSPSVLTLMLPAVSAILCAVVSPPPGLCPQIEPVIVEPCGDKVAPVLMSEDTFLATVTWTTQRGSTHSTDTEPDSRKYLSGIQRA